jgi:hypothetical protein
MKMEHNLLTQKTKMKKLFLFLAVIITLQAQSQGVKFSQLGNAQSSSDASARLVGIENVGGVWNNVLFFPSQINKARMDSVVTAFGTYYLKTAADARFVHYTDTSLMLANYKHWNAGYITRASADARYLQSESDPHRLLYFTVSGTNTKTLVATLADSSKVSIAWTDLQSSGGTGGFTPSGLVTDYIAGDGSYTNFTNAVNSNANVSANTAARHTHSNLTALNNVSGINTGDETTASIKTKLGITTLSGSNTGDQDLSGYATTSALATTNSNVTANTNAIGTLSSLTTTAKSSLVAAINEVNAKPSGGGGSAILYSTTGANTDGAMTQAATTAAIKAERDSIGINLWTDDYTIKGIGDSVEPLRVDTTVIKTVWRARRDSLALVAQIAAGGGGGGTGTPVGANMYRLATQSFSAGVDTKVLLDNTQFDNDGTLADLTNHRINISVTGLYILTVQARITGGAGTNEYVAKALKNGSTELVRGGVFNSDPIQINASMVVNLIAGDYVELYIYAGAAASTLGSSFPQLSPRISIAQIK